MVVAGQDRATMSAQARRDSPPTISSRACHSRPPNFTAKRVTALLWLHGRPLYTRQQIKHYMSSTVVVPSPVVRLNGIASNTIYLPFNVRAELSPFLT
jgi:hypothetical protein